MKLALLHYRRRGEPVWHVQIAVLLAIGLQLVLSNNLTIGPKYVIAGFELVLLVALAIINPDERPASTRLRRNLALALIAVISLANITSLVLVLANLLGGNHGVTGRELIVSGLSIYATNIIIFGLWYWELDNTFQDKSDFLFPQMATSSDVTGHKNWAPTFFDYLYISITNASAFSPTDTLPLTHRAKLLMTVQSMTALLTVALVAARAVNILA